MKNQTLKDLGEAAIIRLIEEKAPLSSRQHVKKGIGDDAAILEPDRDSVQLVTIDTLIEGIHFTARTLSPETLGWKSLAVNMSDIAAMGGTPRTAFLSLGMTPDTEVTFISSFMAGFKAAAQEADIALAGGDVVATRSSKVITVTLLGECPADEVVYRSGARPGHDVWITGFLGNAAGGLFLLLFENPVDRTAYESLVLAHQKPMPRHEIGRALAGNRLAKAMIDVSDGIAGDLAHICEESGVGAVIQAASLPLSDELRKLAAEVKKSPLDWALHGGEDYELLFTASPADEGKILSLTASVLGTPSVKIGRIVDGESVWLETEQGRKAITSGGYTHFSK